MDKDFILIEIKDRVYDLKKRLDRLIFTLIIVSAFGFVNQCGFGEISVVGITIREGTEYHIIMAVTLTVIFGFIGTHLIEYIVKRDALDQQLLAKGIFNNIIDISKLVIPKSLYEFMYTMPFYKARLRVSSAVAMLALFFFSHTISYYHILLAYKDKSNGWFLFWMILISVILILLYVVFIISSGDNQKKNKENENNTNTKLLELQKKIRKWIILVFIAFIVTIPILIWLNVIQASCLEPANMKVYFDSTNF